MKEERTIENPKIYAAIAGVIADCGVVGKDKVNKQQGFKYRSVDDVFNALHPALAKNKVIIVPTVLERKSEVVGKSQKGATIIKVICKVKYDICAEDGSHITSIIYGLAGKRYIEVLKDLGVEEIRRIQKEFQNQLYDDEVMQKQSMSLAILLTADKIATDYLFRDGAYITLQEAKRVLVSRDDLSDNERCYRYLQDKIAMNNQRFDIETKTEKWGVLEKGYAIIYNQAFKELCKSGGFSDKAFLSWANRNGLIETQGDRLTKVKKVDGNPIRCVFLRLNDNIDIDGFESVETMETCEQEELPFK